MVLEAFGLFDILSAPRITATGARSHGERIAADADAEHVLTQAREPDCPAQLHLPASVHSYDDVHLTPVEAIDAARCARAPSVSTVVD
eukprot:6213231-Pleurochrysis_carterae.AAC.3